MFRSALTISGLFLLSALIAGCGSDKGTNPPPPTQKAVRVVVAAAASRPSVSSVDDAVWNGITPTQIDIAQSILAAPRQSELASMSDSVKVQAARWSDSLWIRLQWRDNTHSVWREYYHVTDTVHAFAVGDSGVWFGRQDQEFEDQAIVLFSGLGTNLRDVWNWRALTTDAGFLAEGMKLARIGAGADSLILTADTINTNLLVADTNYAGPNLPKYVSKDSSEFNDYRLYSDDLLPVFIHTHGWRIGQRVPGWFIDTSIYSRPANIRGSRWDIRAASRYDSAAQQYTLVMVCPMNTGYPDDINFTATDSVETQVGLYDDMVLLSAGQFTKKFWLIF